MLAPANSLDRLVGIGALNRLKSKRPRINFINFFGGGAHYW
jgi:hypothetical protein